jgi:nucleoside phosphorylase
VHPAIRYRRGVTHAASVSVLVLAAHAVELEGLPDALRSGHERTYGRDTRVRCERVGVGLTAAGAGTARALALHAPRSVLLTGSFGHYPNRTARSAHEAYVFERVRLADALVSQRKAAFPAPMPTELATDPALNALLEQAGARRLKALATTLGITTDDAAARALGEASSCEGENLEALAVLQACADAGLRTTRKRRAPPAR